MPLPGGLQSVTVEFDPAPVLPNGSYRRGKVKFTASPDAMLSAGVDLAGTVTVTFDASGTPQSVELLATDAAGVTPSGWSYRVDETWYDAPDRSYPIQLPAASPSVNFADIVPTSPSAGEVPGATAFGTSLVSSATPAAARTVLGLGTAATQPVSAFDAAGAAAAAQAAAATYTDALFAVDTESFIAIGDSLTASSGTDWPAAVGAALAVPYVNAGFGGYASTDIAIALGAVRPLLTVTGNQIPASGSVSVTAVTPATSLRRDNGSLTFSYHGYLDTPSGQVAGTFVRTPTALTGTFTRDTPGTAVACPAGTAFVCTDQDARRGWVQTRWLSGRNNDGLTGTVLADVVGDQDLLDRRATGRGTPRALIFGLTWTSTQVRSSAGRLAVDALNTIAAMRYGARFRQPFRWLVDNGLALAGLTPTGQDIIDLANDVLPTSLRSDTAHPNATGYGLIGQYVANELRGAGYFAGKTPTVIPGTLTGLTANPTSSTTVDLAWTALTGSTAYIVEGRMTGSTSGWVYLGNTTGTTLTISNLVTATAYDFRVTPVNVAGRGTSTSASATTTGSLTVVTSDSFNRANSGSLGSTDGGTILAWSSTQNGISSNQGARTGGTNGFDAESVVNAAVTDGRASLVVNVLPINVNELGLIGRSNSGRTDCYMARVQPNGTAYLAKKVGGAFTVLASSAPGVVTPGARVELSVVGTTVILLVDGIERRRVTDSSVASGTFWGFSLPSNTVPRVDAYTLTNA